MPLTHFAFGSLHRAGNLDEQVREFIEHILVPKKLRSFACPEFLPIINNPNALWAKPGSARPIGEDGVAFEEWVPSPPVGLLPNDVWMVSFADLPFNKLRHWKPSEHYGRLGLAFSNAFRHRQRVRKVTYYQYPDLSKDPAVLALNKAINGHDTDARERLSKMALEFRKPAMLWPEIIDLFAVLRLASSPLGVVEIERLTYSRYEVGYDFQAEQEARLVTPEHDRDVAFSESEILAIVVPSSEAHEQIASVLSQHWRVVPRFIEFPV